MKDFLEFAGARYSVRKYKPDAVEEEKIAKILEAARIAPTGCNYQPQKIYVVKSPEKLALLASLTRCTFQAPLVFIIGYDVNRSAKGLISDTNDFGEIDSAIVCTHMMLEAHDLGLGSCWVGMFREEEVKKAFDIPENIRIRDLLPVGYPADGSRPSHLHTDSRSLCDMVEEL